MENSRIGWVDTAKGICIIFVVMMHSTIGVQIATGQEGWMNYVILFAWPFRMPDFFMISGLFLGLVLDRPWLRYLDRKVVHFAYFYLLWMTIEVVLKSPGLMSENGAGAPFREFLLGFVQPYGTLWFIYMLPVFFLFTRLVKGLPVWLVLGWAAILEMLPVDTGSVIFDEFCQRYVFFYAGYALAGRIFAIADWMGAHRRAAMAMLAVWFVAEAAIVFAPVPDALQFINFGNNGFSGMPAISLVLGGTGALAIITAATLLTGLPWMRWLTWLGAHSIVVYLAFFLPMTVARVLLTKTGIIPDIGTMSVLTLAAGVTGPVVLYHLVQWTGYGRFLFERPDWAIIDRPSTPKPAVQPAE
jgi:uncharacterized membrane protein YcfT